MTNPTFSTEFEALDLGAIETVIGGASPGIGEQIGSTVGGFIGYGVGAAGGALINSKLKRGGSLVKQGVEQGSAYTGQQVGSQIGGAIGAWGDRLVHRIGKHAEATPEEVANSFSTGGWGAGA